VTAFLKPRNIRRKKKQWAYPPPLGATPQTALTWSQPPDLLLHPAPLDTNQRRLVSQQFATPSGLWWSQPPDLLKHAAAFDTSIDEGVDSWFQAWATFGPVTPSAFWWTQPPDLLRRGPHLDTNQPQLTLASLVAFAPAGVPWWSQAPDLFRRALNLDTNQLTKPFSGLAAFVPAGVPWWAQPPDLLRRAFNVDTNQLSIPFAGLAAFATPPARWWAQPPDLLRHVPELWANQPYLPPLPSFPGLTPVALGFWAQPPDLLRHAAHLDTNQGLMLWQAPLASAPVITPGIWWWAQPPDLLRHPPALDTNEPQLTFAALQAFATPSALSFWAQPLDLLRHAAALDTNQGLDLWFAPLSFIGALTPSSFWWSQPPDLLRHAPPLDTNESRLVSQQFAEPGIYWWEQPQFQQPRPPDSWAGLSYTSQGWQLTSRGLLAGAPGFMPPRAPDLLSIEPYVAPGWGFAAAAPVVAPGTIALAPSLASALIQPFSPKIFVPSAITPGSLAFYMAPDLLRNAGGTFTWQTILAPPPPPAITPAIGAYLSLAMPAALAPSMFVALPWSWGIQFLPSPFQGGALSIATAARRILGLQKQKISPPQSQPRVLTLQNRVMQEYRRVSRAPDLTPPIIAGVEQQYVLFDFAPGLAIGAAVLSIVAVNCYSLTGTDSTPMARILSVPAITASGVNTGSVPNAAVVALFGNMVAGLYLVQAIVQTSDGQTLSVESRWPCTNPTP
jgi:hypothetical protein